MLFTSLSDEGDICLSALISHMFVDNFDVNGGSKMIKRNLVFGVELHSQCECQFLGCGFFLLLLLENFREGFLANVELNVAEFAFILYVREVALVLQIRIIPFAPQGSPVTTWHQDLNLFKVMVCALAVLSLKISVSFDDSGNEDGLFPTIIFIFSNIVEASSFHGGAFFDRKDTEVTKFCLGLSITVDLNCENITYVCKRVGRVKGVEDDSDVDVVRSDEG